MGDLNGDGLQDVLVRRTSGGTSGTGVIEAVILQRLTNGAFTQITPSSYQLSVAQGWPAVPMNVLLNDFNLDGYIDIVLDDLGSYISGAAGQVILSAGQSGVTGAQALIPMYSKFGQFFSELANWIDNPSWYSANAPPCQCRERHLSGAI